MGREWSQPQTRNEMEKKGTREAWQGISVQMGSCVNDQDVHKKDSEWHFTVQFHRLPQQISCICHVNSRCQPLMIPKREKLD